MAMSKVTLENLSSLEKYTPISFKVLPAKIASTIIIHIN